MNHVRKAVSELTEVWKDIKGYEGLYQVSDMGNVKRVEHEDYKCRQGYRVLKERFLKPCISRGYKKVCLYKDNKQKPFFVHRLVALTFVENPNDYPQINHKDENRMNNNASNLEWCTCKYNINYGTKIQRQRETLIRKNKERKVRNERLPKNQTEYY